MGNLDNAVGQDNAVLLAELVTNKLLNKPLSSDTFLSLVLV